VIAYCDRMPPLEAPCAQTPIGCRMQTLNACYCALPGALDWYRSDAGGVLCRFGNTLLIVGDPDVDALFPFADLLGVSRIESMSPRDEQCHSPVCWKSQSYPLLRCAGEDTSSPENLQTDINLRRCFELLCASDARFAREADYLPWLSDMTRRRNAGRAEAFLYDDAAVACITAKGAHSAYLSSVAVCPERRGEGLGLKLLHAVRAHPTLQGIMIYTAAQSEALAAFYQKAGFEASPQRLIITEKRNPT